VKAFNEDGRDFIRASRGRMKKWNETQKQVVLPSKAWRSDKRKPVPPEVIPVPELINHFVMNLPASAIEFLGTTLCSLLISDAFRGIYREDKELLQTRTAAQLPMIHVYCFQTPAVASETILREVREALGYEIAEQELTIRNVRNVAPSKVNDS
jgi:tRNA (guanine37-N1)-methyltransferase